MKTDNPVKAYRSQFPEYTQGLFVSYVFVLLMNIVAILWVNQHPFYLKTVSIYLTMVFWNVLALFVFIKGLRSKNRIHKYTYLQLGCAMGLFFAGAPVAEKSFLDCKGRQIIFITCNSELAWPFIHWSLHAVALLSAGSYLYFISRYDSVSILRLRTDSTLEYKFKIDDPKNKLKNVDLEAKLEGYIIKREDYSSYAYKQIFFTELKKIRTSEEVVFNVSSPPTLQEVVEWQLTLYQQGKPIIDTNAEYIPMLTG